MTAALSRLAPRRVLAGRANGSGRGIGSRLGKTCGRGVKGQKARHGGNFSKTHFQGGQTPMQRGCRSVGSTCPFRSRR